MKLLSVVIIMFLCQYLQVVTPFNASEFLKHANDSSISFIKGSGRNTFLLENNRRHIIDYQVLKSIEDVLGQSLNVSVLPDDVVIAYPILREDPVVDNIVYTSPYLKPNHWSNEFSTVIQNISQKMSDLRKLNSLKYKDIISSNKLIAIYPTAEKDLLTFRQSLLSALEHLVDIHVFFVVTPNADKLKNDLNVTLPEGRVVFVNDSIFPISCGEVYTIMEETVRKIGVYTLANDKATAYQGTLEWKKNWYLQQILKTYIGGN